MHFLLPSYKNIDSSHPDPNTQRCFTVTAWPMEIAEDSESWYVSAPVDHIYCLTKDDDSGSVSQLLDATSFSYSEASNYKDCVSLKTTDDTHKLSVCAQSKMDLSNIGLTAALMELIQIDP